MYKEINQCLTKGQCNKCDDGTCCPLDDRIYSYLNENNYDPRIIYSYHRIKAKYQDYTSQDNYSTNIILSSVIRN